MKNLSVNNLLLIAAGLLLLSLVTAFLLFYFDNWGAEHLDGTYVEPRSEELAQTVTKVLFVSVPILCLFLGAITSIFIERDIPYRKRFLRGYLYTLGSVYFIYSVLGLSRVVSLLAFN